MTSFFQCQDFFMMMDRRLQSPSVVFIISHSVIIRQWSTTTSVCICIASSHIHVSSILLSSAFVSNCPQKYTLYSFVCIVGGQPFMTNAPSLHRAVNVHIDLTCILFEMVTLSIFSHSVPFFIFIRFQFFFQVGSNRIVCYSVFDFYIRFRSIVFIRFHFILYIIRFLFLFGSTIFFYSVSI
jgi:hypothetical protein